MEKIAKKKSGENGKNRSKEPKTAFQLHLSHEENCEENSRTSLGDPEEQKNSKDQMEIAEGREEKRKWGQRRRRKQQTSAGESWPVERVE